MYFSFVDERLHDSEEHPINEDYNNKRNFMKDNLHAHQMS